MLEDATGLDVAQSAFLPRERALRALGALGGTSAAPHVIAAITPYLSLQPAGMEEKRMAHAGIRSLGRLATRGRPSRGRTPVPLGRQGTGWEVAYATLFLLSGESRYVTAQSLVVDGGLSDLS